MAKTKKFPIAIIRCNIGNPDGPPWPSLAAHRAVIGPTGRWSAIKALEKSHYGYLDFSESRILPEIFEVKPEETISEDIKVDGKTIAYDKARAVLGNALFQKAKDAGFDIDKYKALVAIVRTRKDNRPDIAAQLGKDKWHSSGTYKGLPVEAFGKAGAKGIIGGRGFCILQIYPSIANHHDMTHEIGHTIGYGHAYGIKSMQWGKFTSTYGDPFCTMGGLKIGSSHAVGFLTNLSIAHDWPPETFARAAPAVSPAHVFKQYPAALKGRLKRISYRTWREGNTGTVRLYPATSQKPDRTQLIVLSGKGQGTNPEGSFYVEFRPSQGFDAYLGFNDKFTSIACPAVVIHQLKDTYECWPEADDNKDRPECNSAGQNANETGRSMHLGQVLHFRGRIPVPSSLSRDWHGRGTPYIKVVDYAANGSWVDVLIEKPVASSHRMLHTMDATERKQLSKTIKHTGSAKAVSICDPQGKTFRYDVLAIGEELTIRIGIEGYGTEFGPKPDNPQITWKIGSKSIKVPTDGNHASGTITVKADTRKFNLTSLSTYPKFMDREDEDIEIAYEAYPDGRLILRNRPADGVYSLMVTVTVSDTRSPSSSLNRSQKRQVFFYGQKIDWEKGYTSFIRGCLAELIDFAKKHSYNKKRPWIKQLGPRPDERLIYPVGITKQRPLIRDAVRAFRELKGVDKARTKAIAEMIEQTYGVNLKQLDKLQPARREPIAKRRAVQKATEAGKKIKKTVAGTQKRQKSKTGTLKTTPAAKHPVTVAREALVKKRLAANRRQAMRKAAVKRTAVHKKR